MSRKSSVESRNIFCYSLLIVFYWRPRKDFLEGFFYVLHFKDVSTSLRHDLKNRSHSARRRNFAIKKVHHLPAGGKNVSSARLAGGGSFQL